MKTHRHTHVLDKALQTRYSVVVAATTQIQVHLGAAVDGDGFDGGQRRNPDRVAALLVAGQPHQLVQAADSDDGIGRRGIQTEAGQGDSGFGNGPFCCRRQGRVWPPQTGIATNAAAACCPQDVNEQLKTTGLQHLGAGGPQLGQVCQHGDHLVLDVDRGGGGRSVGQQDGQNARGGKHDQA